MKQFLVSKVKKQVTLPNFNRFNWKQNQNQVDRGHVYKMLT